MNKAQLALGINEIEEAFSPFKAAFVTNVQLQYRRGHFQTTTSASRKHLNEISPAQEKQLAQMWQGDPVTEMTHPNRVDRLNLLCSAHLPQQDDFKPMLLV